MGARTQAHVQVCLPGTSAPPHPVCLTGGTVLLPPGSGPVTELSHRDAPRSLPRISLFCTKTAVRSRAVAASGQPRGECGEDSGRDWGRQTEGRGERPGRKLTLDFPVK